jgi:hypothetical protein
MKRLLYPMICTVLFSATMLSALNAAIVQPTGIEADSHLQIAESSNFTIEDFISMTPEQFGHRSGHKLSWKEKIVYKMLQKKVKKKTAKEKTGVSPKENSNTLSLLSLIGGMIGLVFWFILPVLGLLMAAAGLAIGIYSLKKEGTNALNVLGIVFGGLAILAFLAVVIAFGDLWVFI